jgi:hypothetical protein
MCIQLHSRPYNLARADASRGTSIVITPSFAVSARAEPY